MKQFLTVTSFLALLATPVLAQSTPTPPSAPSASARIACSVGPSGDAEALAQHKAVDVAKDSAGEAGHAASSGSSGGMNANESALGAGSASRSATTAPSTPGTGSATDKMASASKPSDCP
jgi:hypothetical protein